MNQYMFEWYVIEKRVVGPRGRWTWILVMADGREKDLGRKATFGSAEDAARALSVTPRP
jgi:hypothetical protein